MTSPTPLLDKITSPAALRKLPSEDLRQLADELRQETISAVSETGGHLGAGLGVVELTVALHHVFNTPEDRIIWDVGHQAYPHKILTGRATSFVPCAKGVGFPALPSGRKAFMTRSVRRTVRHRFPPVSAWPWRAISWMMTITLLPLLAMGR